MYLVLQKFPDQHLSPDVQSSSFSPFSISCVLKNPSKRRPQTGPGSSVPGQPRNMNEKQLSNRQLLHASPPPARPFKKEPPRRKLHANFKSRHRIIKSCRSDNSYIVSESATFRMTARLYSARPIQRAANSAGMSLRPSSTRPGDAAINIRAKVVGSTTRHRTLHSGVSETMPP